MSCRVDDLPGGVAVVRLSGDLDLTTVEIVRARLDGVADGVGAKLVADLSELRFVDSAGVHLLFTLAGRASHAALAFVVPVESPSWRVLQIAGLPLAAPVFATLDEALASLALPVEGGSVRP
jgi:anti-anti-sigma factor